MVSSYQLVDYYESLQIRYLASVPIVSYFDCAKPQYKIVSFQIFSAKFEFELMSINIEIINQFRDSIDRFIFRDPVVDICSGGC